MGLRDEGSVWTVSVEQSKLVLVSGRINKAALDGSHVAVAEIRSRVKERG